MEKLLAEIAKNSGKFDFERARYREFLVNLHQIFIDEAGVWELSGLPRAKAEQLLINAKDNLFAKYPDFLNAKLSPSIQSIHNKQIKN